MSRVEIYREWQNINPHTLVMHPPMRKWRWRYVSNGHTMADSGQGYSRRIDCLNGCATVLGGEVITNPGDWTDGDAAVIADPIRIGRIISVVDLTKAAS